MSTTSLNIREYLANRLRLPSGEFFAPLFESTVRKLSVAVIFIYVALAILGPYLAPNDPFETQYSDTGRVVSMQSPSSEFLLGTTNFGFDVLSQILYSFRISVFVGAGSAVLVVLIGMNVGLIAGYYGGRVDTVVMMLTDVVYGLPLLPFGIVYVSVLGRSDVNIIIVIGLLVWRTVARVTRSETLSLREREFVKAARAAGTSNLRIIYSHILPNLIPLMVVYLIFGAIWGIMIEASLSFLGLGNPDTVSWGLMLYRVFDQGMFTEAWWWVLAPSLLLWIFIISLYIVSRALEENINNSRRINA